MAQSHHSVRYLVDIVSQTTFRDIYFPGDLGNFLDYHLDPNVEKESKKMPLVDLGIKSLALIDVVAGGKIT